MSDSKLIAALLAGLALSMPATAKMYKWVDDKGTTHYGETIPPEYADKDRVELNKSGRVVKTTDILTPEEREAQRKMLEEQEAEERRLEKEKLEQRRRDRMLISTYSSSDEIELARRRNLQQIELRINGINAQIKIVKGNLANLDKEAENYKKRKRPTPPSLLEDQKETRERLEKLEKDLEQPTAEKAELNARFDADKKRYHELTGK